MDKPTPRIDNSLTAQFQGRTVRVVGRCDSISLSSVQLYSPSPNNDNTVDLQISPDLHFEQGHWYECICRVSSDGSVRGIDNVDVGTSVDEKALVGLIKYTHSAASELFFGDEY